MSISYTKIKEDLEALIKQGNELLSSLNYQTAQSEQKQKIEESYKAKGKDVSNLPSFNTMYEVWYSEALQYVKKIIPDRISDFTSLYKTDKRKEINAATYTISDAIIGISIKHGDSYIVCPKDVLPKVLQQISILKSVTSVVDSVIYSLDFSIRADLFDSELDAASELLNSGFLRAAGAMIGVVLEKHLGQVCVQHGLTLKKKSPTINDYNEELKTASIIDPPTWRYIQLLGDLRNICCHDKKTEPTTEQVNDLLFGTKKITKTVF